MYFWGVLPALLVANETCPDQPAAQKHNHEHFRVQFLILSDDELLGEVASYMRSIFNPAFCSCFRHLDVMDFIVAVLSTKL